jgi:hypothetical protein
MKEVTVEVPTKIPMVYGPCDGELLDVRYPLPPEFRFHVVTAEPDVHVYQLDGDRMVYQGHYPKPGSKPESNPNHEIQKEEQ